MAITPWSWASSNGTASAAHTKSAYTALTSSGNTAAFHRHVWNDLVSKVNEVVTALNLSWADTYGSFLSMPIYFPYENLTAARFNAVRYNTRYNSWSWEYDVSKPWYTGRADFRGVDSVGESTADIVYGRYFLELTERLNVVIGIINGTTPTEDMDLSLISSLLPEVDLFSGASAALGATKSGIIFPSAVLQSENLPSWTLHILVPSPLAHAALETDEISSRLTGYIFMTCSVGERRLIRLPPVPFAAVIPTGVSAQSFLRTVQSLGFTAKVCGASSASGEVNSIASRLIGGSAYSVHTVMGSGVSLPMINPGWCHVRIMLDSRNTLVSDMMREFLSNTETRLFCKSALITRSPRISVGGAEILSSAYSHLLYVPPMGIFAVTEISLPTVSASVGTAEFIKDISASEMFMSPQYEAKVELEHISAMLLTYINILQNSDAFVEHADPTPLSQITSITHSDSSTIGAVVASVIKQAMEVTLSCHGEAHSAEAGILKKEICISLDIIANADKGRSENLKCETAHAIHFSSTTVIFSRTQDICTVSALGHTTKGHVYTSESTPVEAKEILFFPHEVTANLSHIVGLEALMCETPIAHNISGNIEMLNKTAPNFASAEIDVSFSCELGYVLNTELAAVISIKLSTTSETDLEGDGGWQYPTYNDGELTIYQVYLTEKNKSHLFADPIISFAKIDILHDTNGKLEYWIPVSLVWENNYSVDSFASLNYLNPMLWEQPILTAEDIYIRQAVQAHKKQTYKLEVI